MADDRNSPFDLEPDPIPREDDGDAVPPEDTEPPPPPPGATPAALCPRATLRAAMTALSFLLTKGGGTINPRTGASVGRVNAWAVGLGGKGLALPRPPSLSDVEAYVRDHGNILGRIVSVAGSRRLVYLGVWFDGTQTWWLDCTVLIADFEAATTFARANRQDSIHNPAANTTVRIDYDKVPATVKKAA